MIRQPTNREIKWSLRDRMPSLDWVFSRVPPGEPKGAWRVFKAKREGIKYTVQVLSWWPIGAEQVFEAVFFVDEVCVLSHKGHDHKYFALLCAHAIRRLAQQASDRASKLEDALKPKDHQDGYP